MSCPTSFSDAPSRRHTRAARGRLASTPQHTRFSSGQIRASENERLADNRKESQTVRPLARREHVPRHSGAPPARGIAQIGEFHFNFAVRQFM